MGTPRLADINCFEQLIPNKLLFWHLMESSEMNILESVKANCMMNKGCKHNSPKWDWASNQQKTENEHKTNGWYDSAEFKEIHHNNVFKIYIHF